MTRALFQVLVLPFRTGKNGDREYAALRRSDTGYWQGIAGGGEADETPEQAAIRESQEEAGLPKGTRYYRLQSTASIPVCHFAASKNWPQSIYVIPEYAFAVDCTGREIVISEEHSSLEWGTYQEIHDRLHWESNRVALWELDERLQNGDLPEPISF